MRLLLDSFWCAAAGCLHPRVIALSLLPLAAMALLAGALWFFYWDAATGWMRSVLGGWPLLAGFWRWSEGWFSRDLRGTLAPLLVVIAAMPALVIGALLIVALCMAPALTRQVGAQRFPGLVQLKGATALRGALHSTGVTLLGLLALLISMPLWLIPPLVLILPPLIWGWLTYRVMSFDALADYASAPERVELLRRHRLALLGIGVLTGYLGTAPSIVWASGLLFAAAFVVLAPLAIWIHTLVFAFSALWFAHYCLVALAQLRAEAASGQPGPPSALPLTPPLAPTPVLIPAAGPPQNPLTPTLPGTSI